MSTIRYRVWVTDDGDCPGKWNVETLRPDLAAEEFVRGRWESLDSPGSIDVTVRDPDGDDVIFTVHAAPTVLFAAAFARKP